jgi:hypothetical protein
MVGLDVDEEARGRERGGRFVVDSVQELIPSVAGLG